MVVLVPVGVIFQVLLHKTIQKSYGVRTVSIISVAVRLKCSSSCNGTPKTDACIDAGWSEASAITAYTTTTTNEAGGAFGFEGLVW